MEKICKYCKSIITKEKRAIQIRKGIERVRNECKPCRVKISVAWKRKSLEEKKMPCLICGILCIRKMSKPLCSLKCRLLSAIKKESKCWFWTGIIDKHGYGKLRINKKRVLAHRASYEIFVGIIASKMLILHSCNNRACINPDHLKQGTVQDNSNDMINANRSLQGEKHHKAKLTESDVRKIRELGNNLSQQKIANMFGVSQLNVSLILRNKAWKHVI